ncbi:hypothetical protein DFA_09543 [Cavenderia fasciculata]|uniref:EGF-like domain-containing protein n=1 Tax=Cavenderia fasciculata TaxID=261658 RepID=F4Q7X4_CACFS|nr:uncharacterized protein DFA_09543 [Cavenderia fasciculata]EGG15874.1 hypothetical protein DFA_09543 [Cavenderia fasciculata]|eukprot:XP_004352199.1 hypothetical protein DFA_09543 [Cavenderia fasciculata]
MQPPIDPSYLNLLDTRYYRTYYDGGQTHPCVSEFIMLANTNSTDNPIFEFVNTTLEEVLMNRIIENYDYQNDRRVWIASISYPIGEFPIITVNISIAGPLQRIFSLTSTTNVQDTSGTAWVYQDFPAISCDLGAIQNTIGPFEYLSDGISLKFELFQQPFIQTRYDYMNCITPDDGMFSCRAFPNPSSTGYVVTVNMVGKVGVGLNYSAPFVITLSGGAKDINITIPSFIDSSLPPLLLVSNPMQSPPVGYPVDSTISYFTSIGTSVDLKYSTDKFVPIISNTTFGSYMMVPVQGNPKDGLKMMSTFLASNFGTLPSDFFAIDSLSKPSPTSVVKTAYTLNSTKFPPPNLSSSGNSMTDNINTISYRINQLSYPMRFGFDVSASRRDSINYVIPPPFGLTIAGTVNEFTFSTNGLTSPFVTGFVSQQDTNERESTTMTNPFAMQDTQIPIINGLEYKKISTYSYLLILYLDDGYDGSGINRLLYLGMYHGRNTLVSGNFTKGVFVFEYQETMPVAIYTDSNPLTVIDAAWNQFETNYGVFNIHNSLSLIRPSPLLESYVTAENFTHFEFIPNQVDTSVGEKEVSLLFNLTHNIDGSFSRQKDIYCTFVLSTFTSNLPLNFRFLNITVKSYYHPLDQLFRCDFTVPQYTNNMTVYYSFDPTTFTTIQPSIVEKFGSKANLLITSNNSMDYLPPYFEKVEIPTTTTGQIVYKFTIIDGYHGFDNGSIELMTSMNPLVYTTIYLNNLTITTGDIYNGTHEFTINVDPSKCTKDFTVTVGKVLLYDRGGWMSSSKVYLGDYDMGSNNPDHYFNPFFYIADQAFIATSVVCTSGSIDTSFPTIVEFSSSRTTMDVGSNDRNVSFGLVVSDVSGVDGYPTVYLVGNQGEWLAVEPSIKAPTMFNYTATVPHGFGVNGIIFSVYGLKDNVQNLGGYSNLELQNAGFSYMINTTYSTDIPSIYSVSNLYSYPSNVSVASDDEIITIRGRGFGLDSQQLMAFIEYPDGVMRHTVTFVYHIVAFVRYNPRRALPNVPVIVSLTLGTNTHDLSVMPITLPPQVYFPTNTTPPFIPKPTPCSPSSSSTVNCTGNGQCTFDGCICNAGWSGFYCESTVINTDEPTFNQTSPIVDIIVNDTKSHTIIKSIISVVAIRELTMDETVFIEYRPKNWTLNITTPTTDNNNSIIMNYQTQLQDISTIVNVTIEWFSKDSQVVFANQTISIPATSTKVSIGLSSYPFYSSTNTLQVVMKTSIEAEYESECSRKEYGGGSTKDMEWMKLGIDDKTLWGQFIKRGIIDSDRITSITNEILTDYVDDIPRKSNSSFTTTFIGLNLPQYSVSAQLDPNFVHLIDVDNDKTGGSTLESICKAKDNGLTMGQIAGIVVGCIVGAAIAFASALFLVHRRRRLVHQRIMDQKLKRVEQQINK